MAECPLCILELPADGSLPRRRSHDVFHRYRPHANACDCDDRGVWQELCAAWFGEDLQVKASLATAAGSPGYANEDFIGAVPHAAVLLDGAGIRGAELICRHGVAWYAHTLGGALLGLLSRTPEQDLVTILADAIEHVAALHCVTCDIANPSSPQATVVLFRVGSDHAEYLALGDSFLLVGRGPAGPQVITDARELTVRRSCSQVLEGVASGTPQYERARKSYLEMLRARRNQPGGYWIAKDDPQAAEQAVTGRLPAGDLTCAALISNGASRIVDPYQLLAWHELPGLLETAGPAEIIARVRRAERAGLNDGSTTISKPADDASIAYCTNFKSG